MIQRHFQSIKAAGLFGLCAAGVLAFSSGFLLLMGLFAMFVLVGTGLAKLFSA